MTGYECPDCEQPACPGYGCIAGIRLETHAFAPKAVCEVNAPETIRRVYRPMSDRVACVECKSSFMPASSQSKVCGAECRRKRKLRQQKAHKARRTPAKIAEVRRANALYMAARRAL